MDTRHEHPAPGTDTVLPTIYALIWKSHQTDEVFDPEEFEKRIPRLMTWLKELHAAGSLVACGGGGFENHSGGLTLIRASSPERALELAAGSPMNEIGSTELLVWDVFYANLHDASRESRLKD